MNPRQQPRRPPEPPRRANLGPWIGGFALGALALILLRPDRTPAPPAAPKEEPATASQKDAWRPPVPTPTSEPKRPTAQEERARAEADRSAMRAAAQSALDGFRADTYFEQKAGLLYNTVSNCRVVDQSWPSDGNPSFSATYTCRVVTEGLEAQDRSYTVRGSVEKQRDRWVGTIN